MHAIGMLLPVKDIWYHLTLHKFLAIGKNNCIASVTAVLLSLDLKQPFIRRQALPMVE